MSELQGKLEFSGKRTWYAAIMRPEFEACIEPGSSLQLRVLFHENVETLTCANGNWGLVAFTFAHQGQRDKV
jgi:hypothetical protein